MELFRHSSNPLADGSLSFSFDFLSISLFSACLFVSSCCCEELAHKYTKYGLCRKRVSG